MRRCAVRVGVIAALCVALAMAAAGCSHEFISSPNPCVDIQPLNTFDRTIVVAMDRDYEPYSFYDEAGNPSGFDVECANALANAAGFNIEIKLLTWAECIDAVESSEADLVMSLDYLPLEHPNLAFSRAMQNDPFVCFGTEEFDEPFDLADKRLVTIEGSGAVNGFLAPYKLLDKATLCASYTEALQAVAEGHCDYAIARYSVGRRIIAKLGLENVRAVGPQLLDNTLCIGTRAADESLVSEVDKALATLENQGVISQLKDKWLGSYVRFIRLEDVAAVYGAPALLAFSAGVALLCAALVVLYRKRLALTRRESAAMQRLQEYQKLLIAAAEGLYESILEFDITRDRAGSRETEAYFESLGIEAGAPFGQALRHIARRQIKSDYVQGFLDTFSPACVQRAFAQGTDAFSYDFPATTDGGATFYWVRINARLFYWEDDSSLRMIMFRENIEEEKRREMRLMEKAQRDVLTGLLNKAATEDAIRYRLNEGFAKGRKHALLVIDIDDFKVVNDRYGHAFGDEVLVAVASALSDCFRVSDVIGRFGGDEYVVFAEAVPSATWLYRKLAHTVECLVLHFTVGSATFEITSSIGAAVYPDAGSTYDELFDRADRALYEVKNSGKHGFCIADAD